MLIPMRPFQGDPYFAANLPSGADEVYEPINIALASSGSLNVRHRVPAEYIEKIVIDLSRFMQFNRQGRGKGKSAGTGHANGVQRGFSRRPRCARG